MNTKKRILLIEDNADIRLFEKFTLEKAGYEVLESDNAKDGINIAIQEGPDLILLDIRLPYKERGIGAAKILRQSKETAHIPIVFLTAYPRYMDSGEIKSIPNSGFITKDADDNTLLTYIETFLNKDQ